mmetsp:Transcript_51709/g.83445  ORF Transcript_51709/g.83445 Transcript_51709/m.83445 type:complete len:93 (-) Transcript_51709:534-812(-)
MRRSMHRSTFWVRWKTRLVWRRLLFMGRRSLVLIFNIMLRRSEFVTVLEYRVADCKVTCALSVSLKVAGRYWEWCGLCVCIWGCERQLITRV